MSKCINFCTNTFSACTSKLASFHKQNFLPKQLFSIQSHIFSSSKTIKLNSAKILGQRTTGQPRLLAIVQGRYLSLFGHIAQMPDETDAKKIITASPLENWRRPPGCSRTTWIKTIQQDLKSNNLYLDEAINVAQNWPFWRLMSAFGTTHP